MSAGARKLKASVSNLKDLTVRGYRIREDAQHRTLTAYKKIYERDQAAPLPRTVTDKDDRHFSSCRTPFRRQKGNDEGGCAARRKP